MPPDQTNSPPGTTPRPSGLRIRGKMIAIIALPTFLVYVTVLGLMLARQIDSNKREVERTTRDRAVQCGERFDGVFERAAAVALTTAHMLETTPDLTEAQIIAQLSANVLQDDSIYGAAMAFEPGTFKTDNSLYCPYVTRGESSVRVMNITRDVYDWYSDPRWQWWRLAKDSGQPAWTDPYFDEGAGNVLMVTFSAPFHRDGKFRGVTTVDIAVAKIRDQVGRAILGDTDFIILTHKGEFVSAPREQEVMSGRTVFDVMTAAGRPDIAAVCHDAVAGQAGVARFDAWRGPPPPPAGWERWAGRSWLFYAPVKSTGWVLAAMVPESVALGPARARTAEAAVALGVTLLLIIACISIAGTFFTRRISRLAAAVRRIASGDLTHRVAHLGGDELGSLAGDVNIMARDLRRHGEHIARTRSRSREAMIFALAKLAESRDNDTGKHLERICRYTEILAQEVARRDPSLDEEWTQTVTVTAALHDIGKVGLPDGVLKKPGSLTGDERARMQTHTTIGGDTLIAVRREWSEDEFLRIAAEIALGHHERWDGSGYPYGLAGEDISLSARIVSVADVYDALTSKRVYKPAMTHEEAVRLIVEGSGTQFDPKVIDVFRAVEAQFRAISDAEKSG